MAPKDVVVGSHRKVWWQCSRGHEWQTVIDGRSRGRGCPYCSGKAVCEDNCLQIINPELAKEWHPTKNGSLTSKDVVVSSHRKVWWQCSRGHEWKTAIANRSNGTECPYCKSQTSQLELRILCEMRYIFEEVVHRKKIFGKECDIYIPALRLGLEIDGSYWHKDKLVVDTHKSSFFVKKSVNILRIREKPLERISDTDILVSQKEKPFNILLMLVKEIRKHFRLTEPSKNVVEEYLNRKTFANDKEYKALWQILPSPFQGNRLSDVNSSLAKEWHPTRNGGLTPEDVTPYSKKAVWWRCTRGHEWEAVVGSRSSGNGCPYCSGRKVCADNCLQTINPELAKEWHLTKNKNLTPENVTVNSPKKIWWLCTKGHEWKAVISHRSRGTGCPYCSGKAVCEDNCLQTINPELAKEWHPTKNGSLTSKDVVMGSHKKVWWQCSKGHEWQAVVGDRNSGNGCPYCSGQAVCDDNCLQVKNSELAKEWHPTKNGKLTPRNVTLHSNKKVWWQCGKGHEWQAMVNNRSKGKGCPYCSGQAVCDDNCLQTINPKLAREWHPTKNGDLAPQKVTANSGKKVWWQCNRGHEWQTVVANRSKGRGCPICACGHRKTKI